VSKNNQIEQLFRQSRPLFVALGDPVRQELLLNMMNGEVLSVKELAAKTNLSRPTISHHLRILKEAQIIVEHKKGRQTFYRPQPGEYFYTVKRLLETIDIKIQLESETQ
jgi:ArsR family transcriptional regulator, arsenate/arsenite/antimonite-responsive transcriptional repressor